MCFGVLSAGMSVWDALELELHTGVSCYVGVGNWTQVLWKSRQYSRPPSHLSRPLHLSTLLMTKPNSKSVDRHSKAQGRNLWDRARRGMDIKNPRVGYFLLLLVWVFSCLFICGFLFICGVLFLFLLRPLPPGWLLQNINEFHKS